MDISQLLNDWFTSDKTEVEPSLLAYVLLCKLWLYIQTMKRSGTTYTLVLHRFYQECDRSH